MTEERVGRNDVLLVIVASLAFATSGPLGKIATSIPAVTVAAVRTGLAALAVGLLAPRALVTSLRALSNRHRVAVVLAGGLLAAHFVLFLGGLGATSLPAAVALVSLEPLAVVVAAFLAFGLRPTRLEIVGIVLATAGALVVASGAGAGEHRLAGDLMVLGAVVLYGIYVAAARGLRDAMPALPYAAVVYASSTVLLLPLSLAVGLQATPTPPTTGAFLSVLGLALIPTLVGHSLVQSAARHAPPALVALVSPGETVGSLAIGAIAMGALPSPREGAGAALVLLGATIAVLSRRPR
ncbi:transporter of the drug/metabolite transporter (DMT) superfamily [Labilithrix luteola]|uniref:Transporter of the drug/metabolite transporter (DMT) superfamily n=1 Tax=Labilithrix luteola TaxID=1391654 RepID=A0A0K1Q1N2_9BACT|nr:DMT family transporter [Labilithrix luteola]AKU99546.1 transporter of the drug/metabolite transporter (DMT) superfamily [Labilithrix luteola]